MPSEILPKIFLSNCFEVLLGGGCLCSPRAMFFSRYSVLSVLAYSLFSAGAERDVVVGVGPWQRKQGAAVEQEHLGVRGERKRAQLLPAAGQRTNPPVLLAVPCCFMCRLRLCEQGAAGGLSVVLPTKTPLSL